MTSQTGSKSVLVVEDDRDYCHLLHEAFAEAGFRIFEADNGQTALQVLRREPVDLVVSDFIMPELNGLELCRLLRNDLDLSGTKVVLYSCNTDSAFRRKAREMGALDYLPKTNAPELVQRICEVAGFSVPRQRTETPVQSVTAQGASTLDSDVAQLKVLLDNLLDFARIASTGEPSSSPSGRLAWDAILRTSGDIRRLLDAIQAKLAPANGCPVN